MSRFGDIAVDAGLVARAAAGESVARRAIYDAVAGPSFALVRSIVRDRFAAEDLFQDAMETMFRRLDSWRGEAPFGFWVRQIALRRCLMHRRSPWQRAREAIVDMLPELEAPASSVTLAEAIDMTRALERLSPTARAVVWLHDVEGLTHDEIGAEFGSTASFSKSQLSRARTVLRGWLSERESSTCPATVAAIPAVTPEVSR